MVENASAQFLELAAKVSQIVSKNAGAKATQNASFKTYMEQTGKSKQDVRQLKQDAGKKGAQKTDKQDAQSTDSVNKDDANVNTDDTVAVDETKENTNQKEMLIDLAALAQMLSATVVVEANPENTQAQAVQLVLDTTNTQQTAQVGQELFQTTPVAEQTINTANQAVQAQQGNTQVVSPQTQVSVQQTSANDTTTQLAQQQTAQTTTTAAEQAKGAEQLKTETQNNAGQSQNTEVKDTAAKPAEVKVEVNTSQTDGKASTQTALEDGVDTAMFQAPKAEQSEMPVVTVQVGDGGQINGQQMAEDVANAIIKKLPSAPNQFEIQLNPKGLGKITIQILFENNQTLVSLSATNAKAASVLSECAKQIGTLIQQHTGNETVVTVQDDKGLADQQKQQGNRDNAEQQQRENAEKQKRQQLEAQDFVQQMRLGLFDGEFAESRTRFY